MLKRHKKIIIVIIIVIVFILVYHVFKCVTMPSGKKEHLELKNILTIEMNVDKWYSEQKITIKDKEAIENLQDYLNSLELIEVETDYGRYKPGHLYRMFLPYDDISIKGEYLSVHPSGADDKVFTEYYIVNSEYNPLTGGSKISKFLDELINEYAEE